MGMDDDSEDELSDKLGKAIYQGTREKVEALWHAAWAGDLAKVQEILKEGNHDASGKNRWQVDIDPNGWHRTPLHAAAVNGYLDLARFLIEQGADIDAQTKFNDSPLHFAVDNGHTELALLLISKGANLNLTNDDGETPLDLAKKHSNRRVMDALLSQGRANSRK